MPQPKHPSLSLVLVLILGVLLGTIMSLTFKPIVELAFNSYHLLALSVIPTKTQFSEVQTIILFCIIDVALVLGVIVPLLLVLQKKTNIQIT